MVDSPEEILDKLAELASTLSENQTAITAGTGRARQAAPAAIAPAHRRAYGDLMDAAIEQAGGRHMLRTLFADTRRNTGRRIRSGRRSRPATRRRSAGQGIRGHLRDMNIAVVPIPNTNRKRVKKYTDRLFKEGYVKLTDNFPYSRYFTIANKKKMLANFKDIPKNEFGISKAFAKLFKAKMKTRESYKKTWKILLDFSTGTLRDKLAALKEFEDKKASMAQQKFNKAKYFYRGMSINELRSLLDGTYKPIHEITFVTNRYKIAYDYAERGDGVTVEFDAETSRQAGARTPLLSFFTCNKPYKYNNTQNIAWDKFQEAYIPSNNMHNVKITAIYTKNSQVINIARKKGIAVREP